MLFCVFTGGNIQVKIITAGYVGDDEKVHVLSDAESTNFKNMIISILVRIIPHMSFNFKIIDWCPFYLRLF